MLIIGHRGDRQKFEDNTIEGIASAFERGADGVEMDVYYQAKKGVYLTHPYLHDQDKDYPKLEEVIQKFAKKGRLVIEIKTPEIAVVKAVTSLVKKYKLSDYELVSSIFPLIKYIREISPKAQIGLIGNPLVWDWWTEEFGDYFLMSYLKLTKADAIHIGHAGGAGDFWNRKRVKRFHQKGYRVGSHLFTATKKEYEKMASFGFDTCTADKLGVLRWRK